MEEHVHEMMFDQLKADFDGDQGTILIGVSPTKKENWLPITNGIKIREGDWVSVGLTWDKNRKVDYLQGIRRPRWATGIFYKWWYRRVLKQSIKDTLEGKP